MPRGLPRVLLLFNEVGKEMYLVSLSREGRREGRVAARCDSVMFQQVTRHRAGAALMKALDYTTLGTFDRLPLGL
jgi:hypothetical protein